MEYGFKVKTVYIPSWECSQEVFTFYLPQNTPSKAAPLLTLSYLVQQEKKPSFFRSLCHTPSGSQWLMAASSKNKQLKLRHRGEKKSHLLPFIVKGSASNLHSEQNTPAVPHWNCSPSYVRGRATFMQLHHQKPLEAAPFFTRSWCYKTLLLSGKGMSSLWCKVSQTPCSERLQKSKCHLPSPPPSNPEFGCRRAHTGGRFPEVPLPSPPLPDPQAQ